MENQNQSQNWVTLPNFNEMRAAGVDCRLTDFACLTGAIGSPNLPMNYTALYGEVWSRTLADEKHMQTGAFNPGHLFYRWEQYERVPDTYCVGVAPRFCPTAGYKLDTVEMNRQSYLTINRKLPYFPQTKVIDPRLIAAIQQDGVQVGTYENLITHSEPLDFRMQYQDCPCYQYQNQNYLKVTTANGKEHWFVCEPIAAVKSQNGEIQCRNILFASPFCMNRDFAATNYVDENLMNQPKRKLRKLRSVAGMDVAVDVANFTLGQYLNQTLAKNLVRSTQFMQLKKHELVTGLKSAVATQGVQL